MGRYIAKRLVRSVLTLFIILSIVFILVRQMPIDGYFPNLEKMTQEQIQNGLHQMGLDQPILVQLYHFFEGLLTRGDMGVSRIYRNNVAVWDILAPKIPLSIQLGSMSILLSLIIGLPMGVVMAKYKGRFFDHLGTAFIVMIQAVPAAVYYLFIQLYGTECFGLIKLAFFSLIACAIIIGIPFSVMNSRYKDTAHSRYSAVLCGFVCLALVAGIYAVLLRNNVDGFISLFHSVGPVATALMLLIAAVPLIGLPLYLFVSNPKADDRRFESTAGACVVLMVLAFTVTCFCIKSPDFQKETLSLLFKAKKWESWILPVFSMSLGNIAYYAMWLRRYMVDEANKDYVMLARIKGAGESRIMFRHVFRNAFVPMAQYLPTSFLNTVVGSIYIESLYSIPGMGGLLVDVVKKQDNTMIQGIVLLYACVGVIGLLLGDLLMVLFDPRISLSKKGGER